MVYARCGICGNLELQRISPDKVPGWVFIPARILGIPALRCEPCRHKFFAVRPVISAERLKETAEEEGTATTSFVPKRSRPLQY